MLLKKSKLYYWKFSFSWHFGIFCKWLLNFLEFSYLFSLLSPRQSAPFEYSFVSENSSNYWLKQTFCGFFVRQSLSTYPKIEETIQILFLPGWYMADILCISLSYLLLFHCYYCLTGTKNDKTILAGKSIHLSFLWATL